MNRHGMIALTGGALLAATVARADFNSAMKDYTAGRYDIAHREFLSLAELGDCSSQFNLGAMALKGQGGPADTGSGVGWLKAAADNGCEKLVGNKLTSLSASLSPDQSHAADQIIARYGRDALRTQGVIEPDLTCNDDLLARPVAAPTPQYPDRELSQHQAGIVIAMMTIGADGYARDPQILLSEPNDRFAVAAVEAWFNSAFRPAVRNHAPVSERQEVKQIFALTNSKPIADLDVYHNARAAAEAGDPAAAYLVGLTATAEPSLGISAQQGYQMLLGAARGGGADAQYWIGSQLHSTASCHPHADGSIWLRHAAEGGSAAARLQLARDLLAGAAYDAQIAQARSLLTEAASADDYYVQKHVAALLAASPVSAARDPALAQTVAARLAAGDIQTDPQMFEVLALAQAANGHFSEAESLQKAAISRARRLGWDLHAMQERLASYRAHKPWSGDLFAAG